MVVEYGVEVLFLSPSSQIDELTMNVNEISLLVEKIQQNHTVVLASIQNRGTSSCANPYQCQPCYCCC